MLATRIRESDKNRKPNKSTIDIIDDIDLNIPSPDDIST